MSRRHPIYYLNHFNCNCFNVFITNTDRSIIFQCFFIQIPLSHKRYILLWWKWLFNILMGILQICIIEMPNVLARPFKNLLDKVFVLPALVMFQFCRRFRWNSFEMFEISICYDSSWTLHIQYQICYLLRESFFVNYLQNLNIIF